MPQTRDDKARIGSASIVLSLDDDPALVRPRASSVVELAEPALLFSGELVNLLRVGTHLGRVAQQTAVFTDADDVIHPVSITPGEQARYTKSGISTQHHLYFGPDLAQAFHQQADHRRCVESRAAVGRAQVTDQELLATVDVQRQKAIVVVVAHKVRNRSF